MSYNIHHGEGTDGVFDLVRIADLILEHAPDVVALVRSSDRLILASRPIEVTVR